MIAALAAALTGISLIYGNIVNYWICANVRCMTTTALIDTLAIFGEAARGQGKSARTRARLMDAAVAVFARDGYEAASVNEIARAADVANGTFYLHFRDRAEIAASIAFRIAGDVTRQLDGAMSCINGAVDRVSFGTRQFIDLACARPQWGWALFRAVWSLPGLHEQVVSYLRADLEAGVREGVFTVEVDDFLIQTFASMALSTMFLRLTGEAGPEANSKIADLQLRMLGVAPDRAHSAAWRDLAPLTWSESGPPQGGGAVASGIATSNQPSTRRVARTRNGG